MDNLVKEDVLLKTGTDAYSKVKQKAFEYEFTVVKEEIDGDEAPRVEDIVYMKALYHVLPMKYVTIAKLQNKLDGEANRSTVRKLIDKMTQDGYLEAKGNRMLGNDYNDGSTCGVLHSIGSDLTRMKIRSEINQNGSTRSEQISSKTRNHGNTPASGAEPVASSKESFFPGKENARANGNTNYFDEADTVICSRSSQDKRSR